MTIAMTVVDMLKANQNTPMLPNDFKPKINATKKSIHNSCLELVKKGVAEKLEDGRFKLIDGVTEDQLKVALGIQDVIEPDAPEGDEAIKDKGGKSSDLKATAKADFESLLKSVGVDKNVVPTISKLFFDGDTDSLAWLKEVLTRHASGFIAAKELRLVMAAYAKSHNLPAGEFELDDEDLGAGKGAKKPGQTDGKSIGQKLDDATGVGYRIGKDRDGDWVPVAGGPMTYADALDAAQRANYIKAVERGQKAETEEESETGGEPKTPGRAAKPAMNFQEKLMEKLIDKMFDKSHDDDLNGNPAYQALLQSNQQLAAQIQQLQADREQEWRDRMEANMAAIAARDPLGDPNEIARLRQALGVTNTAVTDNSPVVQLIKDSTGRLDKTVDRMVGIFERTALRGDSFQPENKSTPQDRENRAGTLLQQATNKDRSADIRKKAFGV
jgi:hypothetical protein